MSAEYTPTPWRLHPSNVVGSDIVLVANCEIPYGSPRSDVRQANAEYIVRACNAHDELTKLLETARAMWDAWAQDPMSEEQKAARETAVVDAWGPFILAIEASDQALGKA